MYVAGFLLILGLFCSRTVGNYLMSPAGIPAASLALLSSPTAASGT